MKKLIFVISVCLIFLCGCSNGNSDRQLLFGLDNENNTDNAESMENTEKESLDTQVNETDIASPETEDKESGTEESTDLNTTEASSESVFESDESVEKDTPESDNIVSPLAKEMFLTPFDEYSWEKQNDTEYVLIHFTSNVVYNRTNPYDLEENYNIFKQANVSAHYMIDRQGNIYCLIPENRSAWHAGVGTYANDEKYTNKMNKYSIGIELMGIGSLEDMKIYMTAEEYNALDSSLLGFTEEQYASLKLLLADICERNSIEYSKEYIIGHSDFNPNKNDPGELFMWDKLFE